MEENRQMFDPNFHLSEKQALCLSYLHDDITKEIGFGGGAGGGKSFVGVMRIWSVCQRYAGTRWFIGRRELSNLVKTTLNSYFKLGEEYQIPKKFMGKRDKKYNIIKFLNGSEILLLDCANQPSDPLYTRFGSLELTGGFIDESNEIEEQAITILKTRIGRHKNREFGLIPKLLETFNPDQGHIKRRYWTPYKEGQLPLYRKFIASLVTDNPYVDKNYIEQLRNSDELTKQRLLYGNFDWSTDSGKVFRYDEIYDLFRNNIDKSKVYYLSCDVARFGDDKAVIGIWRGLECIKIVTYKENTIDELINKIKELEEEYEIHRNHIVVDSDGVGGGVCDGLRGCINFVNNASPFKFELEKKQYVVKNFGNLKSQCYFKLKELMERRLIRVNADGVTKDDMSGELENIFAKNVDNDGKIYIESKELLKKRIGRSSDYSDMLAMRCIFLVKDLEDSEDKFEGVVETDWSDLLY